MRKDHRENTVGPWAKTKLDALENYLEFYCTALSQKSFKRIYIDGFAGACITKVRSSNPVLEAEYITFSEDVQDVKAQEEFVLGSPIRALTAPHGFYHYFFFDLDQTRANFLHRATEEKKNVTIKVGDCNTLIQQIAPKLKNNNIRGVAFLDPYGAHLEWETVKALADTGTMEVIINFPAAMAINRLITKSGDIPPNWERQLNRCFGTEAWREIAYSKNTDLFGDEVTSKNGNVSEQLLDFYVNRLSNIFQFVATPALIKNTKNSPLYYLIWAGQNKLGLKGADYILKYGEQISQRRKKKKA